MHLENKSVNHVVVSHACALRCAVAYETSGIHYINTMANNGVEYLNGVLLDASTGVDVFLLRSECCIFHF